MFSSPNEYGHQTTGHLHTSHYDESIAKKSNASLLYGEFTVDGLRKALDDKHLRASKAKCAYDLGMGTGKASFQIFLEYNNIKEITGVELSLGRYRLAQRAALNLVAYYPLKYVMEEYTDCVSITIANRVHGNKLKLKCGNLLDEILVSNADFILFDTDIPEATLNKVDMLFSRLKDSCRIISYIKFNEYRYYFNYLKQLEISKKKSDVFLTSWAPSNGHKFYVWEKCKKIKAEEKVRDLSINIPKNLMYTLNMFTCLADEYSWIKKQKQKRKCWTLDSIKEDLNDVVESQEDTIDYDSILYFGSDLVREEPNVPETPLGKRIERDVYEDYFDSTEYEHSKAIMKRNKTNIFYNSYSDDDSDDIYSDSDFD
jgi:SAM-dependent methyltransferase